MRLMACATGVLGGACWLAAAFLDGDPAKLLGWIGIGLLSLSFVCFGFLTASGSLIWLRAIVGLGVFALAWSLINAALAELPDKPVLGTVGGLVLVVSILVFVKSSPSPHHHGAHAR
jgi:hypothetical protein